VVAMLALPPLILGSGLFLHLGCSEEAPPLCKEAGTPLIALGSITCCLLGTYLLGGGSLLSRDSSESSL
jgi:hypothetical protein